MFSYSDLERLVIMVLDMPKKAYVFGNMSSEKWY